MSIYPNAPALLQAGGPSIMLAVIIYLSRSISSNRRLALLAPAILAITVLLLAPAPGFAQPHPNRAERRTSSSRTLTRGPS